MANNESCVKGLAPFNQPESTQSGNQLDPFERFDPQDARLHTVLVKYAPYQMQVRHRARMFHVSLGKRVAPRAWRRTFAMNMLGGYRQQREREIERERERERESFIRNSLSLSLFLSLSLSLSNESACSGAMKK